MRRRGVTVLLGAVVTALLSIGVLGAPIPYVVLGPGPTVDTLGSVEDKQVIQISGVETSDSAGQLRLTTVGVQPDVSLLSAIAGWISDDEAVVPRETVYPPGRTTEEVEEQNKQDFTRSQTSAEVAALQQLGLPLRVVVDSVTADGPSAGKLREGDVLHSVDGTAIADPKTLIDAIQAKPAGTEFTIGYLRDQAPGTAKVTSREQDGAPRIGIGVAEKPPFELSIDLDNIGGPSAGLMFALGIIDKLEPEDLTGGKVIAGTGTIDDAGKVGPIGGIPQKLVGAKAAGADVFLVPADNCAEALRNAQPDLPLLKVGTLGEALNTLELLRSGGDPPRC
ncbi:YlbL family protein [Melissospora conviva]|uniref:YlbL family protein n=1 Tax=Melissospora conviva TaxID=3388432 RepID=UPI003B7616E6